MRARTGAPLLFFGFLLGCDEKPATTQRTVASASAAPSAAPEPPKPWYFGKWTGSYEARRHPLEMSAAEGAVSDWDEDDGGSYSGAGKLEVALDEDGLARASASGPLGDLGGTGKLEDASLMLRLAPKTPSAKAFFGVLTLERKGERLEGSLQASGHNSKILRRADVVLDKASDGG